MKRCPVCLGSKKRSILGFMQIDCDHCDAIGYVKDDIVAENAATESMENHNTRKSKRGRPRKENGERA